MRYFCVTHRDLPWALPSFMTPVGTGDHRPAGGVRLADVRPAWATRNGELGEYAALLALRALLDDPAEGEYIGLCHWRRFPASRLVADLDDINQVVTPEQFEALPVEVLRGDGASVLCSAPFALGRTVLEHYGRFHVRRDLRRLMESAVDEDVVTQAEADAFLEQQVLVPTPSVSVLPLSWFLEIVDGLERVAVRHLAEHSVAREGYQERATGFALERLHSLLLLRLIARHPHVPVRSAPTLLVREARAA